MAIGPRLAWHPMRMRTLFLHGTTLCLDEVLTGWRNSSQENETTQRGGYIPHSNNLHTNNIHLKRVHRHFHVQELNKLSSQTVIYQQNKQISFACHFSHHIQVWQTTYEITFPFSCDLLESACFLFLSMLGNEHHVCLQSSRTA